MTSILQNEEETAEEKEEETELTSLKFEYLKLGEHKEEVKMKTKRRMTQKKATGKTSTEERNWLELPSDVMSLIFTKLGTVDILYRAQFVCSSWRNLSKQPHLFRSIDLRTLGEFYDLYDRSGMIKEAVDRSCGELVEITLSTYPMFNNLFPCIANQLHSLKCLRLHGWIFESEHVIIAIIKKALFVEELELTGIYFLKELMEEIGRSCLHLKYLKLDLKRIQSETYRFGIDGTVYERFESDGTVFEIAKNLPQLRGLHLCYFVLTKDELRAILNRCQYLECLHLEGCVFPRRISKELRKKCMERFKSLTLPD